MTVSETNTLSELPGVVSGRLVRHGDSRGALAELWRAQSSLDMIGLPAVQANLSMSARGVLRGMHFHRRQVDRWIVLHGVAFVALVDVRPMLRDATESPIVSAAVLRPDETVTIPEGVAHGFLALEPLELLYFVTNAYDGTDELGFAWNDPAAAIAWPQVPTDDGAPILSDRDAANPTLAELVATLRG